MLPRYVVLGSSLLCSFFLASHARAQNVAGTFRLSAGGPVFSTETQTLSGGDSTATDQFGDPVQISVDGEAKVTSFGFLGSGFGAGLAGGLSDSVVLGGRVAHESRTVEVAGESTTVSGYSLAPRLEILLGEGNVRPYLLGTFGYRAVTGENLKTSDFLAGAGFGLHLFANDSVSIDPELVAAVFTGTAEVGGIEADSSGFGFQLGVTLSAWFGGEKPSVDERSSAVVATMPAPTSSSSSVVEDDDDIQTVRPKNVAFTDPQGGVTIDMSVGPLPFRLVGRPRKFGNVSSSEIRFPGFVSVCDEAYFELGDEKLPAKEVKISKTSVAVALWETSTLVRISEYEGPARFVGCGVGAKLRKEDRKALASYLKKFQRVAEHFGTWKPAAPTEATAPSAIEPGETAPSDELPSAEPPATDAKPEGAPAER